MLVNEQLVDENLKEKILKFLEVNENTNTTYQILWETMMALLRGKFIVWSSLLKKRKSEINDLKLHVKALGKKMNQHQKQ